MVLYSVSAYPAEPSDYNLAAISDMATKFCVLIGLSDHTIDILTAITSVALGTLIEKHVTLD